MAMPDDPWAGPSKWEYWELHEMNTLGGDATQDENLQPHHYASRSTSRLRADSHAPSQHSSVMTRSRATSTAALSAIENEKTEKPPPNPRRFRINTRPHWVDSKDDEDEDHYPLKVKPSGQLLKTPSQSHARRRNHASSTASERPPSTADRLDPRVCNDGYINPYEAETSKFLEKSSDDSGLFGGHRTPARGKKWDLARENEAPLPRHAPKRETAVLRTPPINSYHKAIVTDEESRWVDYETLKQQIPGYGKPWIGDQQESYIQAAINTLADRGRRSKWYNRAQHTLVSHPLVPLVFRFLIFSTSVIALGLSSFIFKLTKHSGFPQNSSTTMAIVVDAIAIPYIGYVTWDEYTSRPLGLRSSKTKITLVLLDLLFIIFEAANTALAFVALANDNGVCREGNNGSDPVICGRVVALCIILLVALIAWTSTFMVSIFRLVHKVVGMED